MAQLIHDPILERAAVSPDETAVRGPEHRLTYAQLIDQSAEVASGLGSMGHGPGSLVAVFLPRDAPLLVALLGIMRAGAAYLPLDPTDPPGRIQTILEDARPAVVLSTPELAAGLRPGTPTATLDELAGGDAAGPGPPTGDPLAYVIYTSGSTGRPKGVAVPHRCVMALFDAMDHHVEASPGDVWLSLASVAFDVSVFELFWTLARGVTVELAEVSGPALFRTALADADAGITHTQATPTLLAGLMLDPATKRGIGELRHLTATGEGLSPDVARQLRANFHGTLLNAYGPTEATIWATAGQIGDPVPDPMVIGRPLAGQQVHVLDDDGEPVGAGVVGELVIGGTGVTWGYRNHGGLTADRFVPDPFSGVPGARMYRTGDLGHHDGEGCITCLGRNDRQVQIRGYRIELDEVEHVLVGLDGVDAGAVIVEGEADRRRMVAVITANGGEASAIRAALAAQLPAAAVPSEVRVVDAIPTTSSGKIDRRMLGDTAGADQEPPRRGIDHVAVTNDAGQYALWWSTRPLPEGWVRTGITGSREECRTRIAELWTDITPGG